MFAARSHLWLRHITATTDSFRVAAQLQLGRKNRICASDLWHWGPDHSVCVPPVTENDLCRNVFQALGMMSIAVKKGKLLLRDRTAMNTKAKASVCLGSYMSNYIMLQFADVWVYNVCLVERIWGKRERWRNWMQPHNYFPWTILLFPLTRCFAIIWILNKLKPETSWHRR